MFSFNGMMHPTYDVISFFELVVLTAASFTTCSTKMMIMPTFVPNDYMFEKFADKGTEKWEIYAWCLRDAMSIASGLPCTDQSLAEKLEYERFL